MVNKDFVHTKKIDERFGKIIHKAFNRRTKSDYDTYVNYNKEEVEEMFAEMKDFIEEFRKILDMTATG